MEIKEFEDFGSAVMAVVMGIGGHYDLETILLKKGEVVTSNVPRGEKVIIQGKCFCLKTDKGVQTIDNENERVVSILPSQCERYSLLAKSDIFITSFLQRAG